MFTTIHLILACNEFIYGETFIKRDHFLEMNGLRVILLSLFITISFSLTCSEEGFREYLSRYSFKASDSIDRYIE